MKRNNNFDNEFHIPWNDEELKELLKKCIELGEHCKIDFKSIFDINSKEKKSEFLKDVSAIANTFSYDYKNCGFIIFGVSNNSLSYTNFERNEDNLQAAIDVLIKNYINPFIDTYLKIYSDEDGMWGVLVIPQTRKAPHVFIRGIDKKNMGDIFVRCGSSTAKALPDDYIRFYRIHFEESTYEMNEKIRRLELQISSLKDQSINNSAKSVSGDTNILVKNIDDINNFDELPTKLYIEKIMERKEDFVLKKLLQEVDKINEYVYSDKLPWNFDKFDKKSSEKILDELEKISSDFWCSLLILIMRDDECIYNKVIMYVISKIAKSSEPPSGVTYTYSGKYIKFYVLYVTLYIVSITCVSTKKETLLKSILNIELQTKTSYDTPNSIKSVFGKIHLSGDIFKPMYSRYPERNWILPVASYTKIILDRILNTDYFQLDVKNDFYKGEFILSLSLLDITDNSIYKPPYKIPLRGLYLYYDESIPILVKFLQNEKEWIGRIFDRSLKDILKDFDNTAQNIKDAFCGDGFCGNAYNSVYPKE